MYWMFQTSQYVVTVVLRDSIYVLFISISVMFNIVPVQVLNIF